MRFVVGLLAVALVAAITWWAAVITLEPSVDPIAEASLPVLYEVVEGSIGRAVELPVRAVWPATESAPLGRAGLVTSVESADLTEVTEGQVIMTIDLQPVVVADGPIPAFRSLSSGAVGDDVRQLQEFLIRQGYLDDEADGRYGSGTRRAVVDWQAELMPDRKPTGVVLLGDILFVPALPRPAILAAAVAVGSRLDANASPLLLLGEAPDFSIRLGAEQGGLVATGTLVELPAEGWSGTIRSVAADRETGGLVAQVEGTDGEPLCGEACDSIEYTDEGVFFTGTVTVVPELTGPIVPVSALVSNTAGGAGVVLADRSFRQVQVLGADGGVAVVIGLDVGESIHVYGDV